MAVLSLLAPSHPGISSLMNAATHSAFLPQLSKAILQGLAQKPVPQVTLTSSKLFLYNPHSIQGLSPLSVYLLPCEVELSSNVRLSFSGVQRNVCK